MNITLTRIVSHQLDADDALVSLDSDVSDDRGLSLLAELLFSVKSVVAGDR